MRIFGLAIACASLLAAETWYVDSYGGSDGNRGTSPSAAWKSLAKVNETTFHPGDRILLRAGSVWREPLVPRSSGAPGKPIVIDRYGDAGFPRIDAEGKTEDAIRLHNLQHLELRNLEVTNSGTGTAMRRGVHIYLEDFGEASHIVVSGLYVHDVNGTNEKKDSGGIIFRTSGIGKPSRFKGLIIERNIVWKVDRSGIAAQSSHWRRSQWNPSLDVMIRDNLVDDIGGDGIVPWATDGALIEHNIARNCNRRANSYNAGIWPWSTDNSLFQLNEASLTRTTLDGQGFDSDYNSRNTTFAYNYSHDNEGGFFLICSPGKRDPAQNLGNQGTVVHHNISRNDRARIFHLSAAENTLVHDNVVYVGPGLDVQMLLVSDWNGWPDGAVFRNNTFHVEGTARYGHEVSRAKDGTYKIAPGWGPAKGIVFESNRYFGKHIDAPERIEPGQAAKAPTVDWNVPQFDPSEPTGFDDFLKRHRAWMLRLFEAQFGSPVTLAKPRPYSKP
jgi:hypothetical protein